MSKMPEWPKRGTPEPAYGIAAEFMVDANYHEARADAWEARCRLAVEALKDIRDGTGYQSMFGLEPIVDAREALAAIGDLPKEGA